MVYAANLFSVQFSLHYQPLLVHGQYDPLIVGLVVRRDGAVPDEEVGHHEPHSGTQQLALPHLAMVSID